MKVNDHKKLVVRMQFRTLLYLNLLYFVFNFSRYYKNQHRLTQLYSRYEKTESAVFIRQDHILSCMYLRLSITLLIVLL